jgi:hypothetical protein
MLAATPIPNPMRKIALVAFVCMICFLLRSVLLM